jgi:hypothetical protein
LGTISAGALPSTSAVGMGVARAPSRDLSACSEAELDQDVLDVGLCGAMGDDESFGYVLVAETLGDEVGDFALARDVKGLGPAFAVVAAILRGSANA